MRGAVQAHSNDCAAGQCRTMAFNSYVFLLAFLPATVGLYWGCERLFPGRLRLVVLVSATLIFYTFAARAALPILLTSISLNFLLARRILLAAGGWRRFWLILGVSANVLTLLLIKYSGFLLSNLAMLGGRDPVFTGVILPLGISFYTFQQIAFLVDTARGRVGSAHPLTYAASILFFPTILSGPITYFREFAPQVEGPVDRRRIGGDLTIGMVLLLLGLFKKVVIGDSLSLWIDPFFAASVNGAQPGPAIAWAMAAGYLLQLYFDFSGYSDMALGCARMLGIRLPLNFFSPLRVTSIIGWWRRWHMSLGRFVSDYIYQPLALPLTRMAVRRRWGRWPVHLLGVLVPTFVAMFVIGAWHGGSWTFITFGLLHGSFMVIAESWRFCRRGKRYDTRRWHGLAGNLATLCAVLFTMIPFRSPDMSTCTRLWAAMLGLGGQAAPVTWGALPVLGGGAYGAMLLLAGAIAFLLPNSAQFLGRFEPALHWREWRGQASAPLRLVWQPDLAWCVVLGAMLFLGLAFISRGTGGFVYVGY